MRQFCFLLFIAVAATLFAAGQSTAAPAASATSVTAPDYAVKLLQPDKVGEKGDLVISGSKKSHKTIQKPGVEPVEQTEAFDYDLAGAVETLAVDNKGRPTKLRVTVAKVSRTEAGKTAELAPAGTIVQVEAKGGKAVVTPTASNVTLTPEAIEVIEAAGLVNTNGGATDDDIFGTNSRQKVGGSWNMNVEAGRKDMSESLGGEVTGLAGKATLNKVTRIDGVDCLEITMTASFAVTSMAVIPQPLKIEKCAFTSTATTVVPASASAIRVPQSDTLTMTSAITIKAPMPDGQNATIQVTGEESKKVFFKPKAK